MGYTLQHRVRRGSSTDTFSVAEYTGLAGKLLAKANAEVGDTVNIISGTTSYGGKLMPHHEFSGMDIITIKISNGYNVGVKITENSKLSVAKKKEDGATPKKRKKTHSELKQTISVISTGGTIASYVDYKTGAVHPALTAEELIFSVPELAELYNIRAKPLFSIFSEDMKPKHWQRLATEVAKELNAGSSGVIIPHGTDTMHYTSAALAFMLENLTAPVILVGAQRSSDRPSSDASLNLVSAAKLAVSNLGEVVVLMHGSSSDDFLLVHRGTKIRKMHTSTRNAFRSINDSPIARIEGDNIVFLTGYRTRKTGKVKVNTKIEENVALLYFYPSLTADVLEYYAKRSKGIVIAGTGLGHVGTELLEIISKYSSKIPLVMASQCIYGRVNLSVYSTGRELLAKGAIPAEDMHPEVAYVKLMCALGRTRNIEKIKEFMLKDIAGEITDRSIVYEW